MPFFLLLLICYRIDFYPYIFPLNYGEVSGKPCILRLLFA
jgi:hypothetical protein